MGKKTVFVNGSILTLREEGDVYRGLTIDEDRIVDIGTSESVLERAGKDAEIVDLQGGVMIPGFIDSHVHLMSTLFNEIALNLEGCRSIKDIQMCIKGYIKENPKMKLVYCNTLSEFDLEEKRMPTRYEIDIVAKDVPVIISSLEFHTVILNTYAMHMFNIPFTMEFIEKDEDNRFTGKLRNRASMVARKKMYDMLHEDIYFEEIDRVNERILSKGVTGIVSIEGGALFHEKHVDMVLKNRDRFPFDIEILNSTVNVTKVLGQGLPRIGGDVFLDGSFRSHNAALYEGYRDRGDSIGTLFFTREELMEFVHEADGNGLQISVHAVGARAIDLLLDCYEEIIDTKAEIVNPLRHRIEHFELPTKEQIDRASRLNLILCMHPNYEFYFKGPGDMYEIRLGKERASKTNPFRYIYDSNIRIIGGSDSDVMPIDPLLGIEAAVNHSNVESRISAYEGLRMYTVNPAYSLNRELEVGTLEIGKIADVLVLDKNPLMVNKGSIKDIQVMRTYKKGKCVYCREA